MANMGLAPPIPYSSSAHHHSCHTLTNNTHTYPPFIAEPRFIRNSVISNATAVEQSKKKFHDKTIGALCREVRLKYQLSIPLNSNSYTSLFQACTTIKQLQQIHAHMLRSGVNQNNFLAAKLVYSYASYGCMDIARIIFDKAYKHNALLWNAIIRGYAKNRFWEEAVSMYSEMRRGGIQANNFTFPFALKGCAGLMALKDGKEIHAYVVKTGFQADVYAGAALIHMYAKCGVVEDARGVFDKMSVRDLVSWNAMIVGYVQNGYGDRALGVFSQVIQLEESMALDGVTLVSALAACAQLAALRQGKSIHAYVIRRGFEADVFVDTGLVDMYGKCGRIESARQVFDKMSKRDVVAWDAMIAGYSQNGFSSEALEMFHRLQMESLKPNEATMASVLQACAHLGVLQYSKSIHGHVINIGLESDVFVETALIDMYAKCGSIENARQLFDKISNKSVVLWSAMIAGYGMHGYVKDALALLEQMKQMGLKPNDGTFVGVLSACSHAGLVDEGWRFFNSMSRDYGITPRVQHYACMVDLLGRAGQLIEAEEFIKRMPVEPSVGVWGSLLGACRIYCNIELGERVAERLFELEPEHAGYYVLLSNIYAAAGRWADVNKVRKQMKDRGLKKPPGCSVIEIHNKIHTFTVGDRSHPQSEEIYSMLESLAQQMKEAGFVPDMKFVLQDVEEEVKEDLLYSHSEKLAIAFGLINKNAGTPLRIMKNLRMCGDCHNASKFISNIMSQEIILRDANRFHHFKDGTCSCGDYW